MPMRLMSTKKNNNEAFDIVQNTFGWFHSSFRLPRARQMTKADIIICYMRLRRIRAWTRLKQRSRSISFARKPQLHRRNGERGNMLRFSNYTISNRRIDNRGNRTLKSKPKEIDVVGSKVKDVVCWSRCIGRRL